MEKSPKDIDQLFQNHFDKHEVEVRDPESLWKKISTPQKKRRGGIIIFLIIGGAFLLNALISTNEVYHNEKENLQEALSSSVEINDQQETRDSKTDTLSAQLTIRNTEQTSQGTTEINAAKKTVNISDVNEAAIIDMASNKSHLIKENQEPFKSVRLQPSDLRERSRTYFEQTTQVTLAANQNFQKTTDHLVLPNIRPQDKSLSDAILISRSLSKNQLQQLTTLPLTPLERQISPPAFKNGRMEKCEIDKVRFNPFVEAYGTIAVPREVISLAPFAADQTQYLADFNEGFNPVSSLSGGFAIGNYWTNGIGASIGLEYQRIESQYQSKQTITETSTIFDPMAFFFFDQNNEIVWVGDSVTSVTTFDRTIAHAVTTELINLPVQVSYQVMQKDRWNIEAVATGVFNLSLTYRGRFLTSDGTLQVVTASNQDQYIRPRIGVALEGGINLNYGLGPNWELYISPRYRFNSSSYLVSQSALQLSRDFFGVRTGLRYLF